MTKYYYTVDHLGIGIFSEMVFTCKSEQEADKQYIKMMGSPAVTRYIRNGGSIYKSY